MKDIASSLLGRLVDGLSRSRSNVPGVAKVINMPEDYVGSNPTPLTDRTESSSGVERRDNSNPGVAGSSPRLSDFHFPKVSWNEPIGLDECPYMRRWVFDFGAFAIRLHRWQASDDARAWHDHAWWFFTCVLWGSYTDVSWEGDDTLTAGSIRFRGAHHQHTVQILKPGTWTLLVTGPVKRRWGFWVKDKLWKRDRYFANNGHHPCDPGGTPVRLRPDGSRI